MKRAHALVVSTMLALGVAAPPAHAEALSDAMRNFGLIGNWADNCTSPASGSNSHTRYWVVSGNEARLRYDFGPKYQTRTYTIHFATRLSGDRIRMLVTDQADNQNSEMVMRKVNGRVQIYSNVQSDGKAYIKDGVKVLNGDEADWQSRCD